MKSNPSKDETSSIISRPRSAYSIGTDYSDFPEIANCSVGTSQVSVLLSTENLIKSRSVSSQTTIDSNYYLNILLNNEASHQLRIIAQLRKALQVCNFGSCASLHYREAKKLILIATHKRNNVLRQLRRSNTSVGNDELEMNESVSLTLKNFKFASNVRRLTPNRSYMLLVISGCKVLYTELVSSDANGNIKIPDEMIFNNLRNEFEVVLKLYCLETKESPRNIFHKLKELIKLRRSNRNHFQESSFVLWATSVINISNLRKNTLHVLEKVHDSCTLNTNFYFDFQSKLTFENACEGFLTIATETKGRLNWNRYFCRLQGQFFKFYKYESQEQPDGTIDLCYCTNESITLAKREYCPKPRTLHILTAYKPKPEDEDSLLIIRIPEYTIKMHFLSADNADELSSWEKSLNSVVASLRGWSKMKTKLVVHNYEQRCE